MHRRSIARRPLLAYVLGLTNISLAVMFLANSIGLATAQSCSPSNASGLDGSSFRGTIRATGLLGLFGKEGVLTFRDGAMIWTVGSGPQELLPACYTVSKEGTDIRFSSSMRGTTGDTVDWSGLFDGTNLKDVVAIWKRQKGDVVHDLLLPDVVTLKFAAEPRK